jgi:hypothetical protein
VLAGEWDGTKGFGGAIVKNPRDFADEFMGKGDRSDEGAAGSIRGALAHGVVFDFLGGTVES